MYSIIKAVTKIMDIKTSKENRIFLFICSVIFIIEAKSKFRLLLKQLLMHMNKGMLNPTKAIEKGMLIFFY